MASPSFYGFREEDEGYEDTILGKMCSRLKRLEAEGDKMRLEMVNFKKQLTEIKGQGVEEELVKELKGEMEGLRRERLIRDEENKKLKKEMELLKRENECNKKLLKELKQENEALKKSCASGDECVKEKVESIVKNEVKIWNQEMEKEKVSFREVLKEQQKEQEANIEKKVVGVIKNKGGLVRDTVEKKKCLIMFGVKEIKRSSKLLREREEVKKVKEILASLNDEEENEKYEDEVEEVRRLGRFVQGGVRPIKIRFKSQIAAEELLYRAGRFSKSDQYKDVWLKRDLDEEERSKMKELSQCAKDRNEKRTEEEKKEFFWRILDMRLVKWYARKEI